MLKPFRRILKELTGFGLVGILSSIISYLFYLLLIEAFNPTSAYSISYVIGLMVNFLLNSNFVFNSTITVRVLVAFIGSHAINLISSLLLLKSLLTLAVNPEFAPIVVLCIVAPINFILVKKSLRT